MKKLFLLYPIAVLAVISTLLYTACKKPVHALAPTPNNVRLLGYTATTQRSFSNLADTTNDNYTFSYDNYGRVSSITFTTNNPAEIAAMHTQYGENITFYYGNDTCIKTVTGIYGSPVFEIDTLIYSSITSGIMPGDLISTIFTPTAIYNYQYYGKLMSNESDEYHNYYHGVTTVSDSRTYTSDNGNFLSANSTGILNVTFPTTMHYGTYNMRDYWLDIAGLNTSAPNLIEAYTIPQLSGTIHSHLSTNTDVLDYTTPSVPLLIFATDTARDTCYVDYPGNLWPNTAYSFYNNLPNRIGDYLQLASFTQWGNNLYQNNDLVHTIDNSGYTTTVTYNINSYNEIAQMTAVIADSLANTQHVTYNLQYETY